MLLKTVFSSAGAYSISRLSASKVSMQRVTLSGIGPVGRGKFHTVHGGMFQSPCLQPPEIRKGSEETQPRPTVVCCRHASQLGKGKSSTSEPHKETTCDKQEKDVFS